MRRPGQYSDSGINQMMAARIQHMSSQIMQLKSGMSHFAGQGDSLPTDEEHQYMSSEAEGQWQWDREETKGSNLMSSHIYKEGQGSNASRSSFHGQRLDSKLGLEKQANKDSISRVRQDEMEVGYEDYTLPQTFEGLEQKFTQDIMKLTKEQHDAEDTENARRRERLSEINTQYQEKLLAIRARQAANREEFLRNESQARHQQYRQANMNSYQNSAGPSDAYDFGSSSTAASSLGDAHRAAYAAAAAAAGYFDSYGEQSSFGGVARGRGYESRGQYPGGRAYNSGGRYF